MQSKSVTHSEPVSLLTHACVIAIIRVNNPAQVIPICEALFAGGLKALEISLTTPEAVEAIAAVSRKFSGEHLVGAGTVLTAADCRAAIEAGAAFLVSPVSKRELVDMAHELGRPILMGAYTPTECQLAHEMGADFIKLFPADDLGPAYVKALRAPMPHLRIVPTGGVDLKNAPEYLKAGCPALGVASALLPKSAIEGGQWHVISDLAREFMATIEKSRACPN